MFYFYSYVLDAVFKMFFRHVPSYLVTHNYKQVSTKNVRLYLFYGESDTLGVGSAFWSREFSSLKPNMIAWVDKQAQTSQELLSDQYGK